MRDLEGRNALVTGAAGGLGRRIAGELAARGVNVAASGRDEGGLQRLVEGLREGGPRAELVVGDLSDRRATAGLVERAEQVLGPLDILVNNAGVEYAAPFGSLTPDEIQSYVDVNLLAPMVLTRAVLPGMLARGRGHVVNISSVAGKAPIPYVTPYTATKGGVAGFSSALRAELAETPVGISSVLPGFIDGEGMYGRMKAQGQRAPRSFGTTTPERVAAAVVRAIVEDRAEQVVNSLPIRPVFALSAVAPGLAGKLTGLVGAKRFFRGVAQERGRV